MKNQPITVICSYRVKKGREREFKELLKTHWPALREAGLATDREPVFFQGDDGGKGPHFVEIFEWLDEEAPRIAHGTPEVMAVWEPMGKLVESRGENRPALDFPHFRATTL